MSSSYATQKTKPGSETRPWVQGRIRQGRGAAGEGGLGVVTRGGRSKTLSECVQLARDLVAAPANYVTPTRLAEAAREIADETGMLLEVRPSHETSEETGMLLEV